jgi:hypothetical protein
MDEGETEERRGERKEERKREVGERGERNEKKERKKPALQSSNVLQLWVLKSKNGKMKQSGESAAQHE